MKILALIPAYKMMDVPAVQSLCALQADIYKNGDNLNVAFINGFNAVKARSKLIEYASNQGDVDWVINIDTDHVYDSKDLYTLINKCKELNLEMLSAGYMLKDNSGNYAHGSFLEDGSFKHVHADESGGIIDCDVLGFGFLVMRKDFVDKMVKTYGKDDLFLFDVRDNSTEDVYFCRQAKKIGTRICFDSDTVVGHLRLVIQK